MQTLRNKIIHWPAYCLYLWNNNKKWLMNDSLICARRTEAHRVYYFSKQYIFFKFISFLCAWNTRTYIELIAERDCSIWPDVGRWRNCIQWATIKLRKWNFMRPMRWVCVNCDHLIDTCALWTHWMGMDSFVSAWVCRLVCLCACLLIVTK